MQVRCPNCASLVVIQDDDRRSRLECAQCRQPIEISELETADFPGLVDVSAVAPGIPSKIGPYVLFERLSAGAAGEVWEAIDQFTGNRVALKLPRLALRDPSSVERFLREAKVSERLVHENIVRVLQAGVDEGQAYIASERAEGLTLDHWLHNRSLPQQNALVFGRQILRALAHAHRRGVVHRDLKPGNIVVHHNTARVLDFGLARLQDDELGEEVGMLVGTPAYMSPEQAMGRADQADVRSDIFSFGVILYEMLAGRRPFRSETIAGLLSEIRCDEPTRLSQLNDEICEELATVVHRCLAKNPDDRFATAMDVDRAIEQAVSLQSEDMLPVPNTRITSLEERLRQQNEMFVTLKAEHKLYQSLVESLPLCVVRKDRQGQIVFANDYFCNMMNHSEEHLRGKTAEDLFSEKRAQEHRRMEAEVLSTGKVVESVEEHEDGGHGVTFQQTIRSPIRSFQGEVIGVQTLMWDSSARIKVERALREAKEAAEKANQTKNDFLANVSHEIRTPMTAVIGLADLLLKSSLNNSQREYLATIAESAHSLLGVINDILDISKVEAGKLELHLETLDLHKLVDDTLRSHRNRAQEKDLQLTADLDPGVPHFVCADRTRLRQVISNLLGNAVKFSDEGRIQVQVSLDSHAEDHVRLHFRVVDTGIGIPREKLPDIFEPFMQADSSLSRPFGGTGLGLSIARQFVELMKGKIWVESEVGRGSTFHFIVPLQTVDAASESRDDVDDDVSISPLRILIADDVRTNRDIARFELVDHGHEIETAENGGQVLEQLQKDGVDLILMDIQMPELDGWQVTNLIRQREESGARHTPIIAMTAHAMKGDRERCIESGMDGYVSKPIDWKQLKREIARVLPHAVGDGSQRKNAETLVNGEDLLTRIASGDRAFLEKLLESFGRTSSSCLSEMQHALRAGDCKALRDSAHKLKGAVANLLGYDRFQEVDRLLEAAQAGDLDGARELVGEVESRMGRLQEELEPLVRGAV